MKKQIAIMVLCVSSLAMSAAYYNHQDNQTKNQSGTMEQSKDSKQGAIEFCIITFSKAGDMNDEKTIDKCLDENYRVVMNRLFGSEEVSIVDKAVYLEKIRTKEWGGDTRVITIEGILINGNTATAKVKLAGEKASVISIFNLIQNADGQWKIISDVPVFI